MGRPGSVGQFSRSKSTSDSSPGRTEPELTRRIAGWAVSGASRTAARGAPPGARRWGWSCPAGAGGTLRRLGAGVATSRGPRRPAPVRVPPRICAPGSSRPTSDRRPFNVAVVSDHSTLSDLPPASDCSCRYRPFALDRPTHADDQLLPFVAGGSAAAQLWWMKSACAAHRGFARICGRCSLRARQQRPLIRHGQAPGGLGDITPGRHPEPQPGHPPRRSAEATR